MVAMSPYCDIRQMSRYRDTPIMSAYHDTVTVDAPLLNARSLPRLGGAVKRLRRERSLTQSELARRAGVSRQWVIALEQGRTEGLEVGRLLRVLDAMDASLTIRDDSPERRHG